MLNSNVEKKIVIAAPSAATGGAERVAVLLANFFSSAGYKVHYLSLLKDLVEYDLSEAVEYSYCGQDDGNKVYKAFKRCHNFSSIVKKESPVAVISFMTLENIFLVNNKKVLKILSVRNDPHQEYNS